MSTATTHARQSLRPTLGLAGVLDYAGVRHRHSPAPRPGRASGAVIAAHEWWPCSSVARFRKVLSPQHYPDHRAKPQGCHFQARAVLGYCSRTLTLSVAPRASMTVSRTKPGPSGAKNKVRRPPCALSGTPLTMTVSGAAPPAILSATGSGAAPLTVMV